MTNSEIANVIDEHIKGKKAHRDRQMLKSKIIDGYTYEEVAEIYDMSRSQTIRIIKKRESQIAKYLK